MNIDNHIIKRFIRKVYPFMILCSKFIEQNKLVRKIQYEWISQPIQVLFTRQLLCDLVLICVQQLDIVKFALPLVKISFHPIFSAVGKHTNFFMSGQAASRPCFYFTFSITSFAATSSVLTGATSA